MNRIIIKSKGSYEEHHEELWLNGTLVGSTNDTEAMIRTLLEKLRIPYNLEYTYPERVKVEYKEIEINISLENAMINDKIYFENGYVGYKTSQDTVMIMYQGDETPPTEEEFKNMQYMVLGSVLPEKKL